MDDQKRRETNQIRLALIDVSIRARVAAVLGRLESRGLDPLIATDVWRSPAVQLQKFRQGVSKLRWGFHCATTKEGKPGSLAADIVDANLNWNAPASFWLAVGAAAAEFGLSWGGFFGLAREQREHLTAILENFRTSGTIGAKPIFGWDVAHVETAFVSVANAQSGYRIRNQADLNFSNPFEDVYPTRFPTPAKTFIEPTDRVISRGKLILDALRHYENTLSPVVTLHKGVKLSRVASRGATSGVPGTLGTFGIVGAVQAALDFLGAGNGSPVDVDGDFGDLTEAAVIYFQNWAFLSDIGKGIPDTDARGVIGQPTYQALINGVQWKVDTLEKAAREQPTGEGDSEEEAKSILTPDAGDPRPDPQEIGRTEDGARVFVGSEIPRAIGFTRDGEQFEWPAQFGGAGAASVPGNAVTGRDLTADIGNAKIENVKLPTPIALPMDITRADLERARDSANGIPVPVQKPSLMSLAQTYWAYLSAPILAALSKLTGVLSGVPPWTWIALFALGLIVGALIYDRSKTRAHELTKLLAKNRIDPDQPNINLVSAK